MYVDIPLKGIHIWVSWRRNYRFNIKRHMVVENEKDLKVLKKELEKERISYEVKEGTFGYYVYIKGEILAFSDKETILLSVSEKR